MNYALVNGKIATMVRKGEFYEAIGIIDNKISMVGTNEEVMKHVTDTTEVIDLKNKLVVPGFNDSHIHLLNYGYAKSMIKLEAFASIEEMIKESRSFIEENNLDKGHWVMGRGWNQDYMYEKRFPTREDLDTISSDHPICFIRACGHIAIANSAAIEIVQKNSKELNNVDLGTGSFYEDGLEYLYNVIATPSVQNIKDMIKDAGGDFISGGITSVQSDDLATMPDGDYNKVLKAYEELNENNQLPLRVYQQCLLGNKKKLTEFMDKGYKTGYGDEFFKIGPLKLLIDGSLGARTALVHGGYKDNPETCGVAVYTQQELDELAQIANDNGMQVAIHAIGDKAIDMCIESIIKAQGTDINRRNGIVHCQITTDSIIEKMKENNIIAYIQPIFIDYDMHIVANRIGIKRSKKTYCWKTMIENNIVAAGGSDCPVVSYNVLENIYSAVTRKDLKGNPVDGWLKDEKLDVFEALKLFTVNGAYTSFEEEIKGTIEVGKLSDMVVLSNDIFTIEEDDIKDVSVDMTILDGKVVYINQ